MRDGVTAPSREKKNQGKKRSKLREGVGVGNLVKRMTAWIYAVRAGETGGWSLTVNDDAHTALITDRHTSSAK